MNVMGFSWKTNTLFLISEEKKMLRYSCLQLQLTRSQTKPGDIAMSVRIFLIIKVQLYLHGSLICAYVHAFTNTKIGYKNIFFFSWIYILKICFIYIFLNRYPFFPEYVLKAYGFHRLHGLHQRQRQQREPGRGCLLQVAWSRGVYWRSLLPPVLGGFALAVSCSAGGLQPPWHQLEK